jgi:cellulose biosynthesis protein BcsQ
LRRSRHAITAAIYADLEAAGLHVDAIIPRSVTVAEAPRSGKTLLAYAPKSPTANEYGQLARTVRAMLRNAGR